VETKEEKSAWQWDGSKEEYVTEAGKKKKRPVNFSEATYELVSGEKQVEVEAAVQITETSTSEIKKMQTLEATAQSLIKYALYPGDERELYREEPDAKNYKRLKKVDQELFKAESRKYTSEPELIDQCIRDLVSQATVIIAALR
jgi:hypothetical protein